MVNILTVDLEDWYQSSTELFEGDDKNKIIYPTDKVIKNTQKLLKILSETGAKATFFVLGTVAESFPDLIHEIKSDGHEIATHGYSHHLVYKQSPEIFDEDLKSSLSIIEGITKEKVIGYRAPYFSVTENSFWALDVMMRNGIKYDSSIFPMKRKLYGISNSPRYPYTTQEGMQEFPVTTFSLMGYIIPVGGGGYLRLLPYAFVKAGVRQANKNKYPAVIYMHPYEIDADKRELPYGGKFIKDRFAKFTQDLNRTKFEGKFKKLLNESKFTSVMSYLNNNF